MRWAHVGRCDPVAAALANRHYPRRRAARNIGPPGEVVVLRTPEGHALWVTARSTIPRLDAHPFAWSNPHFRNESPHRASDLILEALAATRAVFGDPPPDGVVTYVDPAQVRPNRTPGRVFLRAGFVADGHTAGGHGRPVLLRFWLAPDRVPDAEAPINLAPAFF